ncbi:MAG: DUF192 domain-containing protein [Candidatus Baltobacteraceae bacterium]
MGTLVTVPERRVIARSVARAGSEVSRTVGLLSKSKLNDDDGMWFPRCNAVHTCGMRTAIDIVFLGDRLQIVRIVESAKPWRIYHGGTVAAHTVELAPGTARRTELRLGDALVLEDDVAACEA